MGSIVHRSVPTNLKWFPNFSPAHTLFQDRFQDVQVGSRWFSTLSILSPNFHTAGRLSRPQDAAARSWYSSGSCLSTITIRVATQPPHLDNHSSWYQFNSAKTPTKHAPGGCGQNDGSRQGFAGSALCGHSWPWQRAECAGSRPPVTKSEMTGEFWVAVSQDIGICMIYGPPITTLAILCSRIATSQHNSHKYFPVYIFEVHVMFSSILR